MFIYAVTIKNANIKTLKINTLFLYNMIATAYIYVLAANTTRPKLYNFTNNCYRFDKTFLHGYFSFSLAVMQQYFQTCLQDKSRRKQNTLFPNQLDKKQKEFKQLLRTG